MISRVPSIGSTITRHRQSVFVRCRAGSTSFPPEQAASAMRTERILARDNIGEPGDEHVSSLTRSMR